jgi:predicted permease
MSDLPRDIAFAWRSALKQPATTLLIVVTLALGIGANSAMFSMTWNVMLAPLPYEGGERLMRLEQNEQQEGLFNTAWAIPNFRDFQQQGEVFSDMLLYFRRNYTLLGYGDPYLASTGIVNAEFFDALGIQPALGRGFAASDDDVGAAPVMLLSNELWRERFGADPDIVGTALQIDGRVINVIGVLPAIPPYPDGNDIWVTTAAEPFASSENALSERGGGFVSHVFGKLREGVSRQEAELAVATIAQRLASTYPDAFSERYTVQLESVKDEMLGDSGSTFMLLPALAFLVVLIAAANVANLHLARLLYRSQELAIREALGADPGRIRRQLFTESFLHAFVGGVLGLVIAYLLLELLQRFAADLTPLASTIRMDESVLIFSAFFVLLVGFISGSLSSVKGRDINKALKEGGDKVTTSAGGVKKKQALMIIQYALSFVILVTTALITLSLYRLSGEDVGYEMNQVLVLNTEMTGASTATLPQLIGFLDGLLEQTRNIPGVESAAVIGKPLLQESFFAPPRPFQIDGQPFAANYNLVSEDYFEVMDIPLLKGRFFAETDEFDAPSVVIVNESFEKRFFPKGALGQQIQYFFNKSSTIIGVVPDLRSADLDEQEGDVFYTNFRQGPSGTINLYVKSSLERQQLESAITTVIHGLNPRQPVGSIRSLNEIRTEWLSPRLLVAALIGLFGLLAFVVTLSGVVGVVSSNVSQRVREISVHMAVGANPANIRRLFLAQGLKIYLAGLLAGAVLMIFIAPLLKPLLYQVNAADFRVYLTVVALLTLAVLGAIYLPARKASVMSPAEALHCE